MTNDPKEKRGRRRRRERVMMAAVTGGRGWEAVR